MKNTEKYHTPGMGNFHDSFRKYLTLNLSINLPVFESPWNDIPVMYDNMLRVTLNFVTLALMHHAYGLFILDLPIVSLLPTSEEL